MMPFEDVAIQLVDLPPLSEEHIEPWVFDLIRRADLLWIVLDAADSIDELELVLGVLDRRNIGARPAGPTSPGEERLGRASRKALLVLTGPDKAGAADAIELLDEWARASLARGPRVVRDGRRARGPAAPDFRGARQASRPLPTTRIPRPATKIPRG